MLIWVKSSDTIDVLLNQHAHEKSVAALPLQLSAQFPLIEITILIRMILDFFF